MSKLSENKANNVINVDFSKKNKPTAALDIKTNEKKRLLFAEWLEHGIVSLLLDAREENVQVPPEFSKQGDLLLNFCYEFHIADFNFNESAVWATLSFDSGEHFCSIPWSAVFAMQSPSLNKGAVWFEDFPSDYEEEIVLESFVGL